MRNKFRSSTYLFGLLFVGLVIFGCHGNEKKQFTGAVNTESAIKEDSNIQTKEDSSGTDVNNENLINEKTVFPYKQVDSLKQVITQKYNLSDVKMLDKICSTSDGDLAESFEEISKQLFEHNINDFSDYFLAYPNSCLKKNLIYGLGADLFVYEKAERYSKLLEEQERLILKAKNEGLSDKKIQFIKNIFKDVNPDLLD